MRSECKTLIIVIAAFFFNALSLAEEVAPTAGPVSELEEIVVTGARIETELHDIPQTVDVITPKAVETVKYRNAGELLMRIPGVFTQNLNGEEELTSIRVPTTFSDPYSLLLIDGLPASSYGESAGGLLREIDNTNVQSIEVIKGPTSALYGSNAIGGVINVITKTPSPQLWIKPWAEYGGYSQWRGGISGSGMAGPVGFNADVFLIDSEEWREHSGHEKQAASFRSQYAPSDFSLLDFKLQYIHLDNDTAGTLNAADFENDWQQSYMTFTNTRLDKFTPSLVYTLDALGGELKAAALVRVVDHEVNPNYGIRYNGRTRSYSSYLSKINGADLDLQLLYTRNIHFLSSKILGGVDFERGSSDIDTYNLSVTRDPDTNKYTSFTNTGIGESYGVTTNAGAPYIQLMSSPFDKFNLTMGGRYDTVGYDVEDKLGKGNDGDDDFSRFSPKVGATYDLTPNYNLFAGYSQGFVVPTVSQLFSGQGSNRDLQPEKANNYEVGMRSAFWENRFKFDVSLYYMEIDDKIIVQTVDPVTSAIEYQNVGQTSHKGIETTVALFPWKWMNLAVSYTYAENIYEEFNDPLTGIDYSGNWMPLAPKNRLNTRLALIPIDRLAVELELDVYDKYYVDDANSDTYDRPAILNLRGSYGWKNWTLWAHALNLTNEKYATRVTARNGIFSYFPGNPITIFIGISYQWDKI